MDKTPNKNETVKVPSPIFIVGAPRSGTTLIGRILDNHPDISTPGESQFFEDVYGRRDVFGKLETTNELENAAAHLLTAYKRFGQRGQKIVDRALTLESLVDRTKDLGGGYDGLYLAFMASVAEAEGKTRFCDDTPRHLFSLPTIFRFFPDAKVIGAVRDPRDFLSSYKNYWKVANESERLKALYHPILTALIWKSSAQVLSRARAAFGPDRVRIVAYESLTEKPDQTTQDLCAFLGVDYAPDMIDVETNNSSFARGNRGIFTGSVGRWRITLDEEEIWWTQKLAGKAMGNFGYAPEDADPAFLRISSLAATAPFAFLRAMKANSHRQGNRLDFLRRRLAALLAT